MNPTVQQQAFVDFCLSGVGHGALVARAGCGKTSTILLAVDAVAAANPTADIHICCYNKAIEIEVSAKLKKRGYGEWKKVDGRFIAPKVSASTVHSMGFGLLKFQFKLDAKKDIDDKKVRKIIRAIADDFANRNPGVRNFADEYRAQVEKLVTVGKQAAVGFFDDMPISSAQVWADLANHYDVNGFEDTADLDRVIALAQQVYNLSLADTKSIDYDDMILFPLIKNLRVRFGKDFIYLDEAQDLSRARQALVKKFLKPGGRLMIIGDDRQAIYGFSGADAQALDNLTKTLDATTFPLNVTWRCPKAVVALAQQIVADIQAAPSAPEGEVNSVTEVPADLTIGDAILCRNTAPLITMAYSLIRAGKPAKVEGRAIGDDLVNITNRWKVTTIDAFLKRLEDYRAREVQKAQAKDKDQLVEQINDKCDTLVEICKVCINRKQTSLESVRDFIKSLFADNETDAIILATYHRSKGREWGRVYLFDHYRYCPSKYAKQAWQKHQEQNLAYVAITRAMKSLTFINPVGEIA